MRYRKLLILAVAVACICGSGCSALFESSKPVFDLGASKKSGSLGFFGYNEDGPGPFIVIDTTENLSGLRGTRYSSSSVSCDGFIVDGVPDVLLGTEREATSLSLGLTYMIKQRIGLYGGWGYADRSDFSSFRDPDGGDLAGPFGYYHVDCGSSSNTGLIYGAHLFLNKAWLLGIRQNDAMEETFITIGFDVNQIDLPQFFGGD
ncbi:MAG TPA: hypothetical protein EYN40_01010 [Planctomycetes bacterium]|nr:hypothetical protein [Planctomycetota bacterium]